MSRPLRLEYPGAFYHITSRGDRRGEIYRVDGDRQAFTQLIGEVVKRYRWRIHAWCQMTNHYHLLVETPEPNLSRGMRQLNGGYANYFNRAHGRVGHVFQGRYTAINVQHDTYLLELARYIVLNPVRAKMVVRPEDWQWSSFSATAGYCEPDGWLTTNGVLSPFGSHTKQAILGYRRFVSEGVNAPSPWPSLRNGIFLGDADFVADLLANIEQTKPLDEIPRAQQQATCRTLSEWDAGSPNRNSAITKAYASGAYTLRQIGDYFGLHYSRVSRIVRAAKVEKAKGKT